MKRIYEFEKGSRILDTYRGIAVVGSIYEEGER
jgi:hypothetical protein